LPAGRQAGNVQLAARSSCPHENNCGKLGVACTRRRRNARCDCGLCFRRRPPMNEAVTYYNQPLVKPPVWVWSVPTYFYAGAAAGASLALGATAQLPGRGSLDLLRRCRWIGVTGITAGTGLLIYDLGRPERFYNMLRVFRPTSPM